MVDVELTQNQAAEGIGGALSAFGENSPDSHFTTRISVNKTVWKSNRAQAGGALALTGGTVNCFASGLNEFLHNIASAECTYDFTEKGMPLNDLLAKTTKLREKDGFGTGDRSQGWP